MKHEIEVARDAVRAALGDELADALEWAAAAVAHRTTLVETLRWVAGGECRECENTVHNHDCSTAAVLHALDAEWSRDQVNTAHAMYGLWGGASDSWRPRVRREITSPTEGQYLPGLTPLSETPQ